MPTYQKILGTLVPSVALVLWAIPPVSAQTETSDSNPPAAPAATNPNPSPAAEVARFGAFLDQHPAIEARLRENTDLLSDPVFLKNHPQLATFLDNHPKVKSELAARPRWFLRRELTRPTPAPAPASKEQVTELDRLLDEHPDVARQLSKHPQLLRQPQFLNNHPVLRDYMKLHPEIVLPAAPKAGAQKNAAPKNAAPKASAPNKAAGAERPAAQP